MMPWDYSRFPSGLWRPYEIDIAAFNRNSEHHQPSLARSRRGLLFSSTFTTEHLGGVYIGYTVPWKWKNQPYISMFTM